MRSLAQVFSSHNSSNSSPKRLLSRTFTSHLLRRWDPRYRTRIRSSKIRANVALSYRQYCQMVIQISNSHYNPKASKTSNNPNSKCRCNRWHLCSKCSSNYKIRRSQPKGITKLTKMVQQQSNQLLKSGVEISTSWSWIWTTTPISKAESLSKRHQLPQWP